MSSAIVRRRLPQRCCERLRNRVAFPPSPRSAKGTKLDVDVEYLFEISRDRLQVVKPPFFKSGLAGGCHENMLHQYTNVFLKCSLLRLRSEAAAFPSREAAVRAFACSSSI